MRALTVLYDPSCEFCRGARAWLAAQPKRIPVALVAAGSVEAELLFPELDHAATLGRLTAVDDEGNVYQEEKAWLTALWATREYHAMASRLASAPLLPVARAASEWIGRNRGELHWFDRGSAKRADTQSASPQDIQPACTCSSC